MNFGITAGRKFFNYLRSDNSPGENNFVARQKRTTKMKKPSFFTFFSFLILFVLIGCGDPPTSDNQISSQASDTTEQINANDGNEDEGDLDEIIKQYEPPDRVVWQKPELVINKMGDLGNKTVADLGAGSGFFSRRLAQQAKKVIALDLRPDLISFIDSTKMELRPEYQDRLETRLVTPTDSKLKPGEADIILIVNTYIYIKDRRAYLRHLLNVLPKGGQIIIVDFKKKRMPIKVPPNSIRLELFEVENELVEAGFSHIISDDQSLDYQYIVIAEK